jgi:integrase
MPKRFLFAPSWQDIEAMDKVAERQGSRNHLVHRLLSFGGLREAELVGDQHLQGLHAEHVDFERKLLMIYGKGWASGRSPPREQPIDTRTLELLRKYIEQPKAKEGKLIELSTRQVRRIIKQIGILAKVPHAESMSPHRLRAFYITHVADKYGILAAKELAGHADIRTTQRYVFINPDRKKELQKNYEELFETRPT